MLLFRNLTQKNVKIITGNIIFIMLIVVLATLTSKAQVNADPFGVRTYELNDEKPNSSQQFEPITIIPTSGRFLGTIVPGVERTLLNPEQYALTFMISGEQNAYVSCNAVINNEIGGVILEEFTWEEHDIYAGFQPIGLSTYNGTLSEYQTQLQPIPGSNTKGSTEFRVYPKRIRALPSAATAKQVNFTVTMTVTYTGI
jgi:hypothetical protein